MIGYSTQSKVCKIWDTEKQALIISRYVKFVENSYSSPKTTSEELEETSDSLNAQGGDIS